MDSFHFRYQSPSTQPNQRQETLRQPNKPQRRRIDHEKFESFGLRSNRTKNQKRKDRGSEKKDNGPVRKVQELNWREKSSEDKVKESDTSDK